MGQLYNMADPANPAALTKSQAIALMTEVNQPPLYTVNNGVKLAESWTPPGTSETEYKNGPYQNQQVTQQYLDGIYGPDATVTSFSPTTGATAGGTVVTVTGTGLTGATGVKFGANNGTSFSVVDDSTLKVTTPAGTGSVNVQVLHPNGNVTAATQFTYA